MRLIGTFETEKQAYAFYSFLLKEGVKNIYESFAEEKTNSRRYRIWVYDEDDLEKAVDWMKHYKETPSDPKFQGTDIPLAAVPPSPGYGEISASEDLKWQSVPPERPKARRLSFTLTQGIIALCGLLFLWNAFQEDQIVKDKGELAAQMAMTPLQQELFFDAPSSYQYIQQMIDTVPLSAYKERKDLPQEAIAFLKKADETPTWKGMYAFLEVAKNQGWAAARSEPLFEKIRQGQLWRLFTPCLMHSDFLHILFNMVWVWILAGQIEQRMRTWKMCLLILIIGVVSNLAQYLVSGPYFLGFSGVVVGMAGFIWMRQKYAPWEGYPLQRSTALFLLFFVLAMFIIELFTFSLELFSIIQLSPNIANTAHVIGGLVGMLLGRSSLFSRKVP